MKKFVALKAYIVCTLILAVFVILPGCGGSAGGGHWNKELKSIEVTASLKSMASGTSQQFLATGIYTDDSKNDLTSSVTWTSSNTNVATVASNGVATAKGPGTTTITAADSATGKTLGTFELTVTGATLVRIEVTPFTSSIAPKSTQAFVAMGIFSDARAQDLTSTVSWKSSDLTIATISDPAAKGVATSLIPGVTTITATDPATGVISANATLTVNVAALVSIAVTTVNPANPSIALGTDVTFVATGLYTDGSQKVLPTSATWDSSAKNIATISTSGVASSKAIGETTITVTEVATGKTGTAKLTVTAATLKTIEIELSPVNASIALNTNQQFKAKGIFTDLSSQDLTSTVTWKSSDVTKATISNAIGSYGLATSKAAGQTDITAIDPASKIEKATTLTVTSAKLVSIAVTPAPMDLAVGETKQFTAMGTYDDLSTQELTKYVTWTKPIVSDIANLDNAGGLNGLATGLKVGGPVEITATDAATGISGKANLSVTAALSNPTAPVLGEAGRFVILASSAITTTGTTAISNGDLGIEDLKRSAYAGFTPTGSTGNFTVLTNGTSFGSDDANPAPFPYPLHYSTPVVGAPWTTTGAMLTQAKTDLGIAYKFLADDPNPGAATQVCAQELGGLTLTRGVYKTAQNVTITTGDLHLNAQGDPNAIFIFSIDGTLTTGAPGGSIILENGALAKNVYFRTGGTTVVGAGTFFKGNIFAWSQVNLLAGANLTGSMFAVTEQVTMISSTVTKAP